MRRSCAPSSEAGLGCQSSAANRLKPGFAAALVALFGFALRLFVRLARGEPDYWTNGYTSYYDTARNFLEGYGFCQAPGDGYAQVTPVYPALLAVQLYAGAGFRTLATVQSAIGGLTVLCAFLIGRELFGARAGLLACALTALYPYYVWHDTALQETGVLTCITAMAVLALLRASREALNRYWVLAGVLIGMAVLTKSAMLPFGLGAVVWAGWRKPRNAALVGLPVMVLIGGWVTRNYVRIGAPTLTSQSGRFLWVANNPMTFSHYPRQSIDKSEEEAWKALSAQDLAQIDTLPEAGRSRWFAAKGLAFIRGHPFVAIGFAIRKLGAAFSWRFNPERGDLAELAYLCSYVPLLMLSIASVWVHRRRWREFLPILIAFASFVVVTAIYWAHTSHRSYLDIYLAVFSAAVISRWMPNSPIRT
jgi:4-amino-4-deoxy-L-arabinose transferase-like glycosyltransferase